MDFFRKMQDQKFEMTSSRTHRITTLFTSPYGLRAILIYLFLLHAGLLVWDIKHPQVFMHADRAYSRLDAMQRLLSAFHQGGGWQTVLMEQGIPGDYLPHALLYGLGGPAGIITVQLALLFASVYALYRLVHLLTLSRALAAIAVIAYIHLPHTLAFPHMLSAEALYDPIIVLGFYMLARECIAGKDSMFTSGVLFGMATLIRPVTLLWPVIVAGISIRHRPVLARRFLLWASLPVVCWMGIVFILTGQFSIGSSGHDMGHNLHERVQRITKHMQDPQRAKAQARFLVKQGQEPVLSASEYLNFGLTYPGNFFSYLAHDAMLYVGKSGVEKLTLDYFDLSSALREELQDPATGWRRQLEATGYFATMQSLLVRAPILIISSAAGAAAILMLWLLYLLGVYRIASSANDEDGRGVKLLAWLLVLFPLYVFAISQAVDAMQSRHRAPAEFALCAIAAIGLKSLKYVNRAKNRPVNYIGVPGSITDSQSDRL